MNTRCPLSSVVKYGRGHIVYDQLGESWQEGEAVSGARSDLSDQCRKNP